MAQLIRSNGDTQEVQPQGKAFTQEELQALIGGYIELRQLQDGRWLVMDEDRPYKQLPINDQATALLAMPGYTIGGPVVVLSATERKRLRDD